MLCLRPLFILFVIFLLHIPVSLTASHLHVILVIDTEAKNIEKAMSCNLRLWQKILDSIEHYTNLQIHKTVFTGKEVMLENIIPFISSLEVEPDDAILFYYSGHGYRTWGKNDRWPYFAWTNEKKKVDFHKINQLFLEKDPRFLFSMCDCCNNFLSQFDPDLLDVTTASHKTIAIRKMNYKRLFEENREVVVISSSSPGEFSWAWVTKGSCFTLEFFKVLKWEVCSEEGTEWAIILEKALHGVTEDQTPQYEILELN